MDIKLDSDGDAVFINGALTLAGITYYAQDVVAQRLTIHLRTWLGEWFMDTTYGVPYLQRILVKNVSKTTVDNILREEILKEVGVLEIQEFTSTFDAGTRSYACNFTVLTREGSASISVTV
jgi:hypothetical protein